MAWCASSSRKEEFLGRGKELSSRGIKSLGTAHFRGGSPRSWVSSSGRLTSSESKNKMLWKCGSHLPAAADCDVPGKHENMSAALTGPHTAFRVGPGIPGRMRSTGAESGAVPCCLLWCEMVPGWDRVRLLGSHGLSRADRHFLRD